MTPERAAMQRRLDLAIRLADDIDRMSLEWYQSPDLPVEVKSDGSVVTHVDRDAEAHIRRAVASACPDDGVLGEEFDETLGISGWRWVIDPIDGTDSFTRGIPHYCTLIGIEFERKPWIGVASFPAMRERLQAVRGGGAMWQTATGTMRQAQVSSVAEMHDAVVELGAPRAFERHGVMDARDQISARSRRVRGWSDGYAYALVATGRVDAAVQVGLKVWDYCAFVPIINESGGHMRRWRGTADGRVVERIQASTPGIATALDGCFGDETEPLE